MLTRKSRRIVFVLGCLLVVVAMATAPAADPPRIDRPDATIDVLLEKIAENSRVISRKNAALRDRLGEDRGICASDNFSVMCSPTELDSREVLAKAEALRRQIAIAWLGAELPAGAEFALIDVMLSRDMDEGLTLLSDRRELGHHRVWLTTSKERALGSTLAHEVAHVVLRSRYPRGMPAWANEGIASTFDDTQRKLRRGDLLAAMAKTGNWPMVTTVFDMPRIAPQDEHAYAVGGSITEFLLSRGDRQQFLDFVDQGMKDGWVSALTRVYNISSVEELQNQWTTWVTTAQLSTSSTSSVVANRYHGRPKS